MVWNASCALNYIHTVMKGVIARKYQTKIRELQSFHFGNFCETRIRKFNHRDAKFLLFNVRETCVRPLPLLYRLVKSDDRKMVNVAVHC